MNILKVIFLLFFVGVSGISAYCQQEKEVSKFEDFFEVKTEKHNWAEHLKNNENEVDLVFSVLFFLYKEVLSSQDIDACVFTPSCSVYAIENIKKYGFVLGMLNSFDRLTRCNHGQHKHLPVDPEARKYYDPVE